MDAFLSEIKEVDGDHVDSLWRSVLQNDNGNLIGIISRNEMHFIDSPTINEIELM